MHRQPSASRMDRHEPVDEPQPAQHVEPVPAGPGRDEQDTGDLVGGQEPVLCQKMGDHVVTRFEAPRDREQVVGSSRPAGDRPCQTRAGTGSGAGPRWRDIPRRDISGLARAVDHGLLPGWLGTEWRADHAVRALGIRLGGDPRIRPPRALCAGARCAALRLRMRSFGFESLGARKRRAPTCGSVGQVPNVHRAESALTARTRRRRRRSLRRRTGPKRGGSRTPFRCLAGIRPWTRWPAGSGSPVRQPSSIRPAGPAVCPTIRPTTSSISGAA